MLVTDNNECCNQTSTQSYCAFEMNSSHCLFYTGSNCVAASRRALSERLLSETFSSKPPPSPPSTTTLYVLPTPPSPPSAPVGGEKDPHLYLARGGRADFRGRHGAIYNFLSTLGLAVNVKTEEATFKLHRGKLTVHGSFITEVHLVSRVGGAKRKMATASFWGAELNEFNTGWHVVNGTCGYHSTYTLGMGETKACEELSVRLKFSSAVFSVRGWVIRIRGNYVYGRLSGPEHRLDVTFAVRGGEADPSLTPHGIIGQTFAARTPRHGAVDEYPEEGIFTTTAMAEGAIEGSAAMYEVGSPYATVFAFSRFDHDHGRDRDAWEETQARKAVRGADMWNYD